MGTYSRKYGTWSRHCFRSFKHSFGVPLLALIAGWDVAGCVPGFVSLLSCLFTLSSAICWRISCRAYRKQDDMVKGPSSISVTWNSTHKPDKPEAKGTFVSTLVLHFMVVSYYKLHRKFENLRSHPGIALKTSCIEGCTLTSRTFHCPKSNLVYKDTGVEALNMDIHVLIL